MKNKLLPIITICILAVCIVVSAVVGTLEPSGIDTVMLNDLKIEVENKIGNETNINDLGQNIIVIDNSGTVKFSSRPATQRTYDEWLNFAYQNDLIILDYSHGKIFIFRQQRSVNIIVSVLIASFGIVLSALLIGYWLYIRSTVFKPFKRLENFAGEVAAGNLDSPLLMDKGNAFGAFSESFDILREELKKSRENEIALEKSKKELVAELSHDIKTPIASIKAVAELLELTEKDDKKQKNLRIIKQKASDIDNLITDMFNVTLQDLTELKIELSAVASTEIEKIIKESDYLKKVKNFTLPECLIQTDILRLKQIIGNVLNNSYKYADTEITVTGEIIDKMLSVEFRDYGTGVNDEDLPLITNKFFRGKNQGGKSGAGLGLYICKTILEKTQGEIDCFNTENGFAVRVFLRLA